LRQKILSVPKMSFCLEMKHGHLHQSTGNRQNIAPGWLCRRPMVSPLKTLWRISWGYRAWRCWFMLHPFRCKALVASTGNRFQLDDNRCKHRTAYIRSSRTHQTYAPPVERYGIARMASSRIGVTWKLARLCDLE